MDHADPRYLEAKRSVDRRALSRRVREAMLAGLPPAPRVLEAGCGTGVTVPRLLSWGLREFDYLGVDHDPHVVAFASDVRPKELRYRGYDAVDTRRGGRITASRNGRTVDATFAFETGDALELLPERANEKQIDGRRTGERGADGRRTGERGADVRRTGERGADLVIAGAFLDVVPLQPAIESIESALAPGGLAYLPITFDGGTLFAPEHPLDDAVERAYHAAIDAVEGRNSRAGRATLSLLGGRDGTLLVANASDWIVRPQGESVGEYPEDERWFLDRILSFVDDAVDPSSAAVPGLDRDGFDDWLETRRRQLAAGELSYVAHQYDLLYRAPS
ncbi:methyltransferase type 11 [Halalkaliarchaeum desulfuricum]|uniref:Methyltransferase type 11 n=1 Tax=Halalkaliarchaeum desulfuricum TaxID=2055893 RepID=A0A343TNI0_9EURY|nr:class I SAM-dependent methyltransferase [Halalkaliarchaeum desulfuricum]AUX10652.1 methyltransferase type 11 [Halalkaliarchaeum desulfuricum]